MSTTTPTSLSVAKTLCFYVVPPCVGPCSACLRGSLAQCALSLKRLSAGHGFNLEVCMGVGNPMGIPFPWESHGNGNSHKAHDENTNGNKANGNGNRIYFTRVKIPKIIVMH